MLACLPSTCMICRLTKTSLPQDGAKPFADVYNQWVQPAALPALSMSESFLQAEEIFVSLSATAYVPRKPFT